MSTKKSKVPNDVKRRLELVGADMAELKTKAKHDLNKARNRLQRLMKATGGNIGELSYSAKWAIDLLKPFTTKSGNVSLKTSYNKDVLINIIIRTEKFLNAQTTVSLNRLRLKQEAKEAGLSPKQLSRRKNLWKMAYESGLFDFIEPSDKEAVIDIHTMIQNALDHNMSNAQFYDYIAEVTGGALQVNSEFRQLTNDSEDETYDFSTAEFGAEEW